MSLGESLIKLSQQVKDRKNAKVSYTQNPTTLSASAILNDDRYKVSISCDKTQFSIGETLPEAKVINLIGTLKFEIDSNQKVTKIEFIQAAIE